MNKYLVRLSTKIQENPLPKEPSKPSKWGFEPFEGDQGSHISGIERPPEPDQDSVPELAAGRKTAKSPAPTPLPQELTKPTKLPPVPAPWPEPKITGNPPFGADEVPSRYEAGWTALLAGCPSWAAEWQWTTAIFSCRDLFGEWGAELLRLDWQPNDIFDRWHGLGWFLKSKKVTAIGARQAFLEDGRIFERICR